MNGMKLFGWAFCCLLAVSLSSCTNEQSGSIEEAGDKIEDATDNP